MNLQIHFHINYLCNRLFDLIHRIFERCGVVVYPFKRGRIFGGAASIAPFGDRNQVN